MATKENLRMNFLAAHSKVAFSLSRCAIWNMKLMMMVILVVMMMTTEMINGDDDNVAHMKQGPATVGFGQSRSESEMKNLRNREVKFVENFREFFRF